MQILESLLQCCFYLIVSGSTSGNLSFHPSNHIHLTLRKELLSLKAADFFLKHRTETRVANF